MELFNIKNKVIVITGGGGVLGGSMAEHLLENGAKVIILSRRKETVDNALNNLKKISDNVFGYVSDVLDENVLQEVSNDIIKNFEKIDVLINVAGGNMPGATISEDQTIFDLQIDHFRKVVDLNLTGSVLPSIVFGKTMADNGKGVIINISSIAAQNPLTRVVGYSASKASIENFTKWMSTELATKFGEGIRVNAVAPGFYIGIQNKDLLIKEDGSYTERGQKIINGTPMKRFGKPEELNGTIQYLCSEASKFITGAVIPVDGGYAAFSGV